MTSRNLPINGQQDTELQPLPHAIPVNAIHIVEESTVTESSDNLPEAEATIELERRHIYGFIDEVIRRMRKAGNRWDESRARLSPRKLWRAFDLDPKTSAKVCWALLAFIVATVYLVKNFESQKAVENLGYYQNSTAYRQAMTDEISLFYKWKYDICPKELASNVTNQACVDALREATPPPPKPLYVGYNTLSVRAAKLSIPLVDAGSVLAADITHSFELGRVAQLTNFGPNTTVLASHAAIEQRNIHEINSETQFFMPLPDFKESVHTWTSLFKGYFVIYGTTWKVLIDGAVLLFIVLLFKAFNRYQDTYRRFSGYRIVVWWDFTYILLAMDYLMYLATNVRSLVYSVAKDHFIDECLEELINGNLVNQHCSILTRTPDGTEIPVRIAIETWSVWRGYYFSQILDHTVDDLVLFFIASITLKGGIAVYKTLRTVWHLQRTPAVQSDLPLLEAADLSDSKEKHHGG